MNYKKTLILAVFFLFMYGAGVGAAKIVDVFSSSDLVKKETENWGLGFGTEGTTPTGNVSAEELKEYDAYYVGDPAEKKIYLTFDCGYENGNTEKIMDALKKHNAQGTFFVVGNFLETAPDIVKRMQKEGHLVGNHTYHHPDMSKISDLSSFQKEMDDVANLYKEITGEDMIKLYRPPQGKFSLENLKMAKELGYHTFFWSLAYVDWYQDNQPSAEEAYSKLMPRIHPGAIVLLHSTSSTNGEILDELLTKWEDLGYTFGSLEEFLIEEKDVQKDNTQEDNAQRNDTQEDDMQRNDTREDDAQGNTAQTEDMR